MKWVNRISINLFFIIYVIFSFVINPNTWGAVSKNGAVVYYADPSQPDQGVTGNGRTIKAIVDAIGSDNNATIKIRDLNADGWTDYNFFTNTTIPSNIILNIDPSPRFISNGESSNLIINGSVKAGSYKVFNFTGTGSMSGLKKNNLRWFGGPANNSNTNFKSTMVNAVAATAEKGTILIPSFGTTYSIKYASCLHMSNYRKSISVQFLGRTGIGSIFAGISDLFTKSIDPGKAMMMFNGAMAIFGRQAIGNNKPQS